MKKDISIKEMLDYSNDLWELNKDKWSPMEPEYGRDSLLYMIEEVGEVIALIKKKGESEIMNNLETRKRFVEELTDVLMYYSDILNRFDIDSEEFANSYHKKMQYNLNRNFIKDHSEY